MATSIQLEAFLTKKAKEEFPKAFELLSDTVLYTFKTQTLPDGSRVDMVRIGLYDVYHNTRDRKPLWAHISDDVARYYHEGSSQFLLVEIEDKVLYPDEGTIRHKDGPDAFRFVTPGKWSSSKEVKRGEREQARARLASLVDFAFILTGRTSQTKKSDNETLFQLKELCLYLLKVKDKAQQIAEDNGDGEYQPAKYARGRASMPSQSGFGKNKRTADKMEGVERKQSIRNPRNRTIDLSVSPVRRNRTSTPLPIRGSGEIQRRVNDLVEFVEEEQGGEREREKEKWAAEKEELRSQVESLQAKLDDMRRDVREGQECKRMLEAIQEVMQT